MCCVCGREGGSPSGSHFLLSGGLAKSETVLQDSLFMMLPHNAIERAVRCCSDGPRSTSFNGVIHGRRMVHWITSGSSPFRAVVLLRLEAEFLQSACEGTHSLADRHSLPEAVPPDEARRGERHCDLWSSVCLTCFSCCCSPVVVRGGRCDYAKVFALVEVVSR